MTPRTVAETIQALPRPNVPRLAAPAYTGTRSDGLGLAVASMRDHTSDEGWQLFQALEHAGYKLAGHDVQSDGGLMAARRIDDIHVPRILWRAQPGVVVMQDKREWDVQPRDFRDPAARFYGVEALANHGDIFRLTVLKDAHQRPEYHRDSAQEIGAHAWIVYYHPQIVAHVAPYVRPEHLIRTWHSLDSSLVPPYSVERRTGCLLSGALSSVYPLRQRLTREASRLPNATVIRHPGYHRNGCATPEFLRTLSWYKVAVCTSSIYGYALRKIVEATAAGCVVVTDLPADEVMPEIDDNLARVHPDWSTRRIAAIIREIMDTYNPELQRERARRAQAWYDWRAVGLRLAADIEAMRRGYSCRSSES